MNTVAAIIASVALLLASALCLIGAIGVIRFPDALSRMHAATKPQVLGGILAALGMALLLPTWSSVVVSIVVVIIQLLTLPSAGYLVSRAVYLESRRETGEK